MESRSEGSKPRRMARNSLAVAVVLVVTAVMAFAGFAGLVFAEEKRTGSIVVFGGPIHVRPDEVVEGDVVSLGNSITVDGRVTGDAVSVGSTVEVNGEVEGDVVSVGSTVFLGGGARVGGNVTSIGGSVERCPGAVVGGTINERGRPFRFDFRGMPRPRAWGWWYMPRAYFGLMWFARLVGALVLALVVVALWPNHSAAVGAAVETRLGRAALVGLVAWLLFVPGMILLAVTLIGIPLVPVWILFYVVSGIFGHAAISVVVGDKVGRLANARMSILVKVLVGALVLGALGLIPVLGVIVGLAVAIIGVGAVLDTRFGTNRPWLPPRQPQPQPQPQPGPGPQPGPEPQPEPAVHPLPQPHDDTEPGTRTAEEPAPPQAAGAGPVDPRQEG